MRLLYLLEKPESMPTIRQVITVQKLSEIIRKQKHLKHKHISMGSILKAAGYSDSVALHPDLVTKSKGLKELLDVYLSEESLTKAHSELIQASKLDSYKMDANLTDEQVIELVESVAGCKVRKILRTKGEPWVTAYFWYPDGVVRKAAIDMAYKLRGSYAPEKHSVEAEFSVVEVTNYGKPKQEKSAV